MGSKHVEEKIHATETLLREGMKRKGVDEAARQEVLLMIASSAKLQFPKSHAPLRDEGGIARLSLT
jgi:DNA polymerase III alpha subunit